MILSVVTYELLFTCTNITSLSLFFSHRVHQINRCLTGVYTRVTIPKSAISYDAITVFKFTLDLSNLIPVALRQ